VLARELKKAVNAEKSTVYVINIDLQRVYAGYFDNPRTIGKIRCGGNWIYVHTDSSKDFEEPLFPSINYLVKGSRSNEAIMRSVILHSFPYLGVQMKTPLDRSKSEFTGSDDQKVKIICELAAVKLDSLLSIHEVKEERKQMSSILHICSEIVNSRNHQGITEKINDLFPDYFQFAKASIAFYDPDNSELFSCVPELTGGLHFTDEVVRFPSSLGLSWSLLERGGILAMSEMKMYRKSFHPEMDNLAGISDIRNMMIGCLPGRDNEPIGIIQLANKLNGINPEDEGKLKDCLQLIGACVSCANTINECVSLVIQMKSTVDLVVQVLESSDLGKTEFESNLLFSQLTSIRSKLGSWTKSKKKQLAIIQA
jgi:hypothetical protein